MVSTFTEVIKQGDSGPSAEKSSNSDIGGNFSQASREPSNEGTCPKPTRERHTPDKRQLKTRRKGLKIGTWNVQTLYKVGQFENLKVEITALNLDILGIAETRWNDDEKRSNEHYEFIYSGNDTHQYGVGIMMKKCRYMYGWILASIRQNYHDETERKAIQHQHNSSICTDNRPWR